MELSLNDDQEMLRNTAQGFMAAEAPVSALRKLRDSDDPKGYSPELWSKFAEMGFAGILISEDEGGVGMGHVEAGLVLQEIGRNLTVSPFLNTAVGGATALKQGSAGHRAEWLGKIASGEALVALGLDEKKKHHPSMVETRAERDGNGFKLSGKKSFVPMAHVSDLLIVSARTSGAAGEPDGITLFAVDAKAAGIDLRTERLVDSQMSSEITLDNVRVDGDAVIGDVDNGWAAMQPVLRAVSAGAAAELVGVADGAMAMTVDYLKSRKQFGTEIGTFQALQHRAAHLYSEMELARAAVRKSEVLLDANDDEADHAVSVAKAMAGMTNTLAVQEGVQMHGGIGMTDEYDVGFYMKRGRSLNEFFGDASYHADKLAKAAGY